MPQPIYFEKAKAERYLDCLNNGTPIEGVHSLNDYLALAGACHFAALSQGPARISDRDWGKIPLEHREASDEQHMADTTAAVEFYSQLSMLVRHGEYDDQFEPTFQGIVYTGDEGRSMHPIEGMKGRD